MLGNPGTYANKKRKKPVLKQKKISDLNAVVKSNPSKRHRDRLNGELDRLMDLLPFNEEVRSRLDKLSVLRLSVGYLRVKSYFRAVMKNTNSSRMFPGGSGQNGDNVDPAACSEGDLLLEALNGFVLVVTSEGLVFYASPTIRDYLGFHQSDVVHQSVFDLIHTDDRATFREQLHFALNPPAEAGDGDALQSHGNAATYHPEQLPPENSSFLERSFVCRFRCLLDNSSGFLALKFQGRLKYLHGQSFMSSSSSSRPQLALFAIAMPVQAPAIVEIRAKLLLFQSKHKLDFTPMAIDSRGKIILGYSETELRMKGSGYQFIHAADMMYCADNHIRMIKTGESGMTVFRLLSKSGTWVWVKSNAKLIFKGGRPEFIIAYQRAIATSEGESYLRQRRLQLPFSFTTGEGVLYNTGPTVDVSQFQFNKMFDSGDVKKDVAPSSLLDCFLSQDEMAYTETAETPLPVDQAFLDSRALLSVSSNSWQDAAPVMDKSVLVKEEAKQSVAAVMDSLEKMANSGNFSAALRDLEVDDAALMELETALKGMSQDEEQQNNVRMELDCILANDVFDYIESVLFKEKGEDSRGSVPPSCLTGANQQDFAPAARFPGLGEPQLFHTPSPDRTYPPMSSLYAHQQGAFKGAGLTGPSVAESPLIFTQKLSQQGPPMPPADGGLPPLQQLQLKDIFSPSIELPELTIPANDAFQSHGQAPARHLGVPAHVQQANQLLLRPNTLPTPAGTTPLLQSAVQQPNTDILPPLISCKDLSSSNMPVGFSGPCVQDSLPFENLQPWPQSQQQQKLPHAAIVQNGHEATPAFPNAESQPFPCTGYWPRSVTGLNHMQQEVPAGGQAAAQSSCMFDQHFSSRPPGSDVRALSGPSGLRGANSCLDQSPPQGSCYFQWGRSEPVVGTSVISQETIDISPLNATPSMQHYMAGGRQTQNGGVTAEPNGLFIHPAHDVSAYLME